MVHDEEAARLVQGVSSMVRAADVLLLREFLCIGNRGGVAGRRQAEGSRAGCILVGLNVGRCGVYLSSSEGAGMKSKRPEQWPDAGQMPIPKRRKKHEKRHRQSKAKR